MVDATSDRDRSRVQYPFGKEAPHDAGADPFPDLVSCERDCVWSRIQRCVADRPVLHRRLFIQHSHCEKLIKVVALEAEIKLAIRFGRFTVAGPPWRPDNEDYFRHSIDRLRHFARGLFRQWRV